MGHDDGTSARRPTAADWLAAVGHPIRIEILHKLLTARTAAPSEIAAACALPLGTVSYHLRVLTEKGIVRLAGRTQRRGASVRHYRLIDRERGVAVLWGLRATLLVTDIERDHGSDATVTLDAEALAQADALTADYLARLGELGLQTRERVGGTIGSAKPRAELTKVAILLATNPGPRDEPR